MKLCDMLPFFMGESTETAKVLNVLQKRIDEHKALFRNFSNELFVYSADESLYLWEKMCGIKTMEGKSIQERRSAVLAKLRGGGTCTKEKLCEIALSFECGEIEVSENAANYTVTITFISEKGAPARMNEFMAAIEAVKPAHIKVLYVYTYRKWGEFSAKTWGDLSGFTWQEIKEMEDINEI